MNAQTMRTNAKQFMTRLAFSYEYKIPYSIVMDRVRKGELALHFVDGKVQINVEEGLSACQRKRPPRGAEVDRPLPGDLFA
jgi:hypothetical protein